MERGRKSRQRSGEEERGREGGRRGERREEEGGRRGERREGEEEGGRRGEREQNRKTTYNVLIQISPSLPDGWLHVALTHSPI